MTTRAPWNPHYFKFNQSLIGERTHCAWSPGVAFHSDYGDQRYTRSTAQTSPCAWPSLNMSQFHYYWQVALFNVLKCLHLHEPWMCQMDSSCARASMQGVATAQSISIIISEVAHLSCLPKVADKKKHHLLFHTHREMFGWFCCLSFFSDTIKLIITTLITPGWNAPALTDVLSTERERKGRRERGRQIERER